MSGDVQPKKRKDKRRRKEDEELYGHFKQPTDEVIHVQKETNVGGNICTKIIFFLLLAAIGITVGLILIEHQGSTDENIVHSDKNVWPLTFNTWLEYLPLISDLLRDNTHYSSDEISNGKYSKHDEYEIQEEEEEEAEVIAEQEINELDTEISESWLDFGSILFSNFEFNLNFGSGNEEEVDKETEDVDTAQSNEEKDEEIDKSEGNDVDEEEEEDNDDEAEKSGELDDENEDDLQESEEKQDIDDGDEEEEEDKDENEQDDEEEEEEDMSLEYLGRETEDEYVEDSEVKDVEESKEEEKDVEDSAEEKDKEEKDVDSVEEQEEEDEEKDHEEDIFHRPNDNESGEQVENNDNEVDERIDTDESIISNQNTAQSENSEEELFPEAIEALKREASELLRAQAMAAEDKEEPENLIEEKSEQNEDETDGTDANQQQKLKDLKSKEESTAIPEVPTFEAVRIPAYTTPPPPPISDVQQQKEEIKPSIQPTPRPPPPPQMVNKPLEVSDDDEEEEVEEEEVEEQLDEEEEEIVEEEEEVEGGGDDDIDEDIGLSPKRYEELLAKYGQPTPDSSDIEQSDDEPPEVREYSEGKEAESVGEEESGNELEESEPEVIEGEEEETYIKVEKPLVKAPTPMKPESDGEDEEEEEEEVEEEEEESEDEAPPPPPPQPKPQPKTPTASATATRGRDRGGGGPKDVEDYPNADITNFDDWAIKEELDLAEEEFNFDRIQSAMDKFTLLLNKRPKSPRALYGIARAFDLQAEAKSSNQLLDKAIDAYTSVIQLGSQLPDELFRRVADRLINRLRFRGQHMKAVPVHQKLIKRFNNTVQYRNDMAINYLMVNRLDEAALIFKETLSNWPNNSMARAHYGLVLKLQGKMKESISHLLDGLKADDISTRDARLYFHLGDALTRTGDPDQAMNIYMDGVKKGLFRSKYQRSLYNVDRLEARPWWSLEQTRYQEFFKKLENNWKQIKEEGLTALKWKGLYQDEAESLRDFGDWKQFELFARGIKYDANCRKTPITCSLIEQFPPARTCKRGQTKFSVMSGGTHVWPHCGPTNCRLRAHLGLVVPKEEIAIRVADETKKWAEGKVLIFDDSFEHEVWHNGTKPRLVLIVDVWHPDLNSQEIRQLSPI